MIVTFTYTDFTLIAAVNYVKNLINSSTDLNFQQRSDCIEAINNIPSDSLLADGYFDYTGTFGYKCQVTYNATQNYENNTVDAYVSLQINSEAPSETLANPTAAASAIPDPAPALSAWTPPATPTLPAIGALSTNFTNINGISVIIPASAANFDSNNQNSFLRYHTIGGYAVVSNPASNYIKATVVRTGPGRLPDYTLARLYVNGTVATSGYSIGNRSTINLYTSLSADSTVTFVIYTQSDNANAAWIPATTMQTYGGVRFINGSCRGYVVGASALGSLPKYDIAMTLDGAVGGTYIGQADMKSAIPPYAILNQGKNFHYSFNNALSTNPIYGYLMNGSSFTGTGGTANGNVYDVVIEATITPPLTSNTIPFKIYTPYTFAVTGQPVWVQTVLPDSKIYTKITADWGDGIVTNYTTSTNTEFYFAHTYTSASDVPYTLVVTAQNNSGTKVATVSATRKFYIQEKYPILDLENYAETLGINLTLPNTRDQVTIGSNEWVVADNINASFNKLVDNFNYLNKVSDSIKKNTDFTLVEWLRDLSEYSVWNNDLTGSNQFFTASGSYTGVIPADTFVDFKSYPNGFAAPDFYNYFAYSNGQIQIRKNNYNNTLVNQLTALTDNSEPLNIYGIDTDGTDLYVLASLNNSNNSKGYASVYRYYVGNASNAIVPTNQIGGSNGNRSDKVNFSGSQPPSAIRLINDNVYIGDTGNKCIKIYNPALTHINTIYTEHLSAYNVIGFDVGPSESIYVLGKLYAPNPPVLTSVILSAGQYRVTWGHDGERLNQTLSPSANFKIYGNPHLTSDEVLIDSIYSNYAALSAPGAPKLTTYVFSTSSTYDYFKVQAVGYDGILTSEKSSSKVIPNEITFPTPYKIFVYNIKNELLKTLTIDEIPPTADIKKILIDPAEVFLYIITSDYVYKYTTSGYFINRITSPSVTNNSLGTIEKIVTGFIDKNHYFYILTQKRVFKFTDLPATENILNDTVNSLYTSNSGATIASDEYIVDWVYNKALVPLIYNHELLAKSIIKKYVVTLDGKDNLVDFKIRDLSATELIQTLDYTDSNYIYSNEIVSSAVVNRTIERIYNAQETILNTLKPEVIRTTPSYLTNILGRYTAASGNIVEQYIPPSVGTTTTTTTLQPLPVLFSFASANYTGNVYSELYGGRSRYGNDFVATFSLINATTGCNLIIDARESTTGSGFADRVRITVKQDSNIIYTLFTSSATAIHIPLNKTLQTDSTELGLDGKSGTYGANFEVSLSLGTTTSTDNVKPEITVTSTEGYLFNATFKNSVMGTTYPSSILTVYDLSGSTIPYAGIINNTLGGYLTENTYVSHTWRINNSNLGTNPGINITPKALSAVSVSAARFTNGESELLFGLNREVITAPEPPYYTVIINSTETYGGQAGANVGSGHAYGGGTYKAGTVVPITAIATYGSFGRWAFNTNVFRLSGVGTNNTWITNPVATNVSNNNGGRYDGTLYVDGDKTVDVAYYHS